MQFQGAVAKGAQHQVSKNIKYITQNITYSMAILSLLDMIHTQCIVYLPLSRDETRIRLAYYVAAVCY